jgi:hypothetical protein
MYHENIKFQKYHKILPFCSQYLTVRTKLSLNIGETLSKKQLKIANQFADIWDCKKYVKNVGITSLFGSKTLMLVMYSIHTFNL